MAILHRKKINAEDDLGFGTQAVIKNQPLLIRDGSVNVRRKGISIFNTADNYHNLISMSWRKFWLLVFAVYLVVNIIFAFIYVAIGPGSIEGDGDRIMSQFLNAFFFSAQTTQKIIGIGGPQ